ncbi:MULTISPECIES: RagB/SusD family nutrient uptake outer membrane protein [Flammeovirga]|uniref:RagB/SusD family nutrient uptake outer membrane protein n=1 Tax=Flammeovirga agarivorans TaxID=2726742 RepID=A0A7X8SQ92_9BACT|nr:MULTISPECIES: RagB/SusD family nutrient uptake outer membrane protein [Flammeovirga]NLR94298.1 RagB/SusD family nutrient uptake outer membrane protein [Flammeovirga agarivorans]
MKNIKKYIAGGVLAAFVMMGCSEDEFLTQDNPNSITPAFFWKTNEDFNKATNTVYAALQFGSVSGSNRSYDMVRGDLAGTENWYPQYPFAELTVNDASEYVQNRWNELYIGIFRANQVLENLGNEDTELTDDEKVSFEAQVRFLRAFYYFELVNTYGKAVVHTSVVKSQEEFNRPTSTMAEVYESVIMPDLEFAQANLPQEWTDKGDIGRATWGAATSLIGKAKLYNQDFAGAAETFKEVIDSRVYSLTSELIDNHTDLNEFNAESIFETTYSDVLKPGAPGQTVDDNPNETSGEATGLAWQTAPLSAGGYNTVLTSYYLHELMVYDELDPTNSANEGKEHSIRMNASIVPVNYDDLYFEEESGTKTGWAYGQSAYVKKHSNWYQTQYEDSQERSGINWRHIRYADVLLMYAEAVLESTGDFQTAMTYIDMIRSRAGVKTLETYTLENAGQFPALHRSVQVHGTHELVTPSVETVRTHLRMVERPLELCFEGHRWRDLVRWGNVQEVLTQNKADEDWRLNNFESIENAAPLFIVERVRPDYQVAADIYDSNTHDYFPIPTGETQINTGLSQ